MTVSVPNKNGPMCARTMYHDKRLGKRKRRKSGIDSREQHHRNAKSKDTFPNYRKFIPCLRTNRDENIGIIELSKYNEELGMQLCSKTKRASIHTISKWCRIYCIPIAVHRWFGIDECRRIMRYSCTSERYNLCFR